MAFQGTQRQGAAPVHSSRHGADPGADQIAESELHSALRQAALKEFEPLEELLELKMSFIFVCFLAPVMPIGLIATLVARLFEIRSKLTKLFFVRRRCFPGDARLHHGTQGAFVFICAYLAVVWHAGLDWVTYNSDLSSQGGALQALVGWFMTSVGIMALSAFISRQMRRRGKSCSGRSTISRIMSGGLDFAFPFKAFPNGAKQGFEAV